MAARKKLHRDLCMVLLLADLMQNVGAAKMNAMDAGVQVLDLSPGV
jgi:hypothetical protein